MALSASLPTLYEYYTGGGVVNGLSDKQPYFTLNDRNISIYSGAMHYFRVPRKYWRDRLRRMRAAGLNTVETYVPWNLHEPQEGYFDFGEGGSDMEDFLHLEEFLKTAQEEDLFAIVRPGPFICSEWEFGGFPSWLLRYKGIKLRTSQQAFMQHVTKYFNILLPILTMLQFTTGGPIIAIQVENEYGSTEQDKKFTPDKLYLEQLRQLMLTNGIVELLFTSDSPTIHGDIGTLPKYFLQTANFASHPVNEFKKLQQLQPNKPVMAMEFWSGWFDHWSEIHHTKSNKIFQDILQQIINYPASVNMYMFQGGTNWGFLNGANIADSSTDNKGYQPDTTSYDYDAPISENGDYTEKYVTVKKLLSAYNGKFKTPQSPGIHLRKAYDNITVVQQLYLNEIIKQAPYKFPRQNILPMEFLPINNNSGQAYGYIVYRKENITIEPNSVLKIAGRVCDSVMVLINGVLISTPLRSSKDLNGFGYWRLKDSTINLGPRQISGATLELVVENWGRNNFGYLDQFNQLKGLWQGGVSINNKQVFDWEILPLEFRTQWTNDLSGWHDVSSWMPQPALYRVVLNIEDEPSDSYIDMSGWNKGVVIVNGFVLGRHALIGPQQSLYLPAPLLKSGENEIVIFEHFYAARVVQFTENPIFKTK